MNTQKRRIRRWLAVLAAVLCLVTVVPFASAVAADNYRQENYEIALVFDNSGSMFAQSHNGPGRSYWCSAKYGMEIFASMLDFSNGDRMTVFPMGEVTTDGSKTGGTTAPFTIASPADISKITKMYTVKDESTPFKPVTDAMSYLTSQSSADNKWLVIMADGEFSGKTADSVQKSFEDLAKKAEQNDIKIVFVGFGDAKGFRNIGDTFKSLSGINENQLQSTLVDVCNSIFGRDELKGALNGTQLRLDISCKKIIVFAQGKNAKIGTLSGGPNNTTVQKIQDSGQRVASTVTGGGAYAKHAVQLHNLAGQVATFGACEKGNYALDCTGYDSVQVFYEPDVEVEIDLTDTAGNPVDFSGEVPPGDYVVTYRLVDRVTREDVTNSDLVKAKLGATVVPSESEPYTVENGATITLNPDDATDIVVEGTYLDKYKISSKDNPNALPFPFKVGDLQEQFVASFSFKQDNKWYVTGEHESWKPIYVDLRLEGQPLTAEQMARTTFQVEFSPEITHRVERLDAESAYAVYIGYDDSGTYTEPACGGYDIKVQAHYIDEFAKESVANAGDHFDVQWYQLFWVWLFWILILLLLLFLIISFLNRSVLPKAVYISIPKSRTVQPARINGTTINLSTDLFPGEMRCEAKACTPFRVRKKRIAKFKIKRMMPIGSVKWYEVDGMRFTKNANGRYVNDDDELISEVNPLITAGDETELRWSTNNHTVTAYIYINHNS